MRIWFVLHIGVIKRQKSQCLAAERWPMQTARMTQHKFDVESFVVFRWFPGPSVDTSGIL